jgi:single-stranded-DNA-specific exonuclease
MAGEWPADAEAIDAARKFIDECSGRVVIASHNDADGLSAAAIAMRAMAARGIEAVPMPSRRGEHVHKDSMRERIAALSPNALIVCDMGTRPGAIIEGLPTLVVDHHHPSSGTPDGAIVLNGHDREPVATSSVLMYVACRHLPGHDAKWLAALGAVGDLGGAKEFDELIGMEARGTAWTKAVSLINAARRAPEDDAMTALDVLLRATSPQDIALARVPGVDRLEEYRQSVQREVARCSRIAPKVMGDAAVIRFSSGAQVHPIVATRWSSRLAPKVVIAANKGFIPGRVNFAIRCGADINLLDWLRALPFTPSPDAEYANGHPRATGGSLSLTDFEALIRTITDD